LIARPDQPFEILFEDEGLLVVNKLLPLPVLPDGSGGPDLREAIRRSLAARDGRPPAVLEAIHRLDRPVSGCVAYAKSQEALTRFSALFKDRAARKIYLAAVHPAPAREEAARSHLIGWNKARSKAFVGPVDPAARGGKARRDMKLAVLRYKLAGRGERYALLEIELITGRHHQIRAQLASIGCPVKGDVKYGARRPNPNGLIALHARSLEFPEGLGIPRIVAPFPPGEGVWAALEGGPGPRVSSTS